MAVFTGLGSQATPSITFSADTDTGVFSPGANQVAITTAGTARLNVSAAGEVTTANERLNLIVVGIGAGAIVTNTAVGCQTLAGNTTGCGNTAIGHVALCENITGCFNTATGSGTLSSNTTGIANTALGHVALCENITGSFNTAAGSSGLGSNTTGEQNTALGHAALFSNTTGCFNTASGFAALCSNTTGLCNTANGLSALAGNITGCFNTAIGQGALFSSTTGSNNIAVGVNAGFTGGIPLGIVNITTESNRIVMGNDDHTCAQIKVAWTVVSDCRDKTCFAPIPHGLDFVRALAPTEYRFKEGGRDSEIAEEKRRYGFLAQDILPLEGDDPVIISTSDPDKLQYTEAHLIPVLVRAIQELAQRVQELENA